MNSGHHQPNSPEPLDALQFQHQTCLSIELPSSVQEFNSDDEPTTPTSLDHKIPVPTTCPPAPRKPRSVPMGNNKKKKRKRANIQRISVDLMVMINAMCVPPAVVAVPDIMAGDLGAGDRVKKVKKANVTIGSST